LAEHFDKNGDFEIHVDKSLDEENEFKIVSAIFFSRHSNKSEYFTVIKYIPGETISKWICSCMSGTRTCGCCSHVASFIYYLSYARYLSEPLKKPGDSLNRVLLSLKKDEFSEDEDNESQIITTNSIENISDNIEECNIISQIIDLTENTELKIKRTYSANDQLNKSIKKTSTTKINNSTATIILEKINTSSKSQQSQVIKSSQLKNKFLSSFENNISFREFTAHIPKWGGVIDINENDFFTKSDFSKYFDYRNIVFNNTCTIDYFLLGMWCISKLSSCTSLKKYNENSHITIKYLRKIVDLIDEDDWDRARTLWI
jgi:hypothetical protein